MKYKNFILPHGGKLRYVKNNISKTTSVEIDFYCGARCEKIPGLAHFTEHMFFTGTKDLNKEQVTKNTLILSMLMLQHTIIEFVLMEMFSQKSWKIIAKLLQC